MTKIKIEIDNEYRESLDLLKQVIPDLDWKEVKSDSKMVEVLIDSFVSFLKQESCSCWNNCQCGEEIEYVEEYWEDWSDWE